MTRKLKTYVTSIGFFDLAVSAPSMKAASEAWGTSQKLFDQGAAEETDDPAIVAATMASPGIVLKRAVGTSGAYTQDAALPKSIPANPKPRDLAPSKTPATKSKPSRKSDEKADRRAVIDFGKERKRRETQAIQEEARRKKERAKQSHEIDKAERALRVAQKGHENTVAEIDAAREKIDRRAAIEEERWAAHKEKLEKAISNSGKVN